jgi:ATP-dependent RNA helicase RhlE
MSRRRCPAFCTENAGQKKRLRYATASEPGLEHNSISSAAIHANRTQNQRQKALEGFKRRFHKVLVATDIAARGIDVDDILHVVNFDTPVYAEDYIHRIGRNGRAEAKGSAFTFVSSDEERYMKRIEYLTRKRFELKRYPGFLSGSPAEAPAPAPRSTQFQRQRKSTGLSGSREGDAGTPVGPPAFCCIQDDLKIGQDAQDCAWINRI